MNFWRLLRVINTRKWLILALAAVTVLVVIAAAPSPDIVYEASAYMSPTSQVMSGGMTTAKQDSNNNNPPDRSVILSNLIILARGGEVFQKAMDFLALYPDKQKTEAPDIPDFRQISFISNKKGNPITYNDWIDIVDVSPVRNAAIGEKGTTTDIIRIKVRLNDPEMSPYVANAVGYAFTQVFLEKSREDSRKYIKFLESSKAEVKTKLHGLNENISQYKQTHNVISINEETLNALASSANLEGQRSAADAAVREAQAALNDINAQLASQPLVVNNPMPSDMNPNVIKLKEELNNAESQLRLLQTKYTPTHEKYKAQAAQIAILKDRLKQEGAVYNPPAINEIHQSLERKRSEARFILASARAKLSSINSSIGRADSKARNLTVAEPDLAEMLRDYTQTENKYNMLSEKLATAQISEKEFTRTGSIVPFDWARSPAFGPIVMGPTKRALSIYGLILSLIIGIMVSVWLDSIDNKMRNAADVEELMQLPVLGLTPQLSSKEGSLPKLTHLFPLSAVAESYRILRTNILFELRDTPFKTLMVATGRPGQGATTTICNLAIALAQIGRKIILIDADMRRPSLHNFFDVPNEIGLSTLLQGKCNLTDAFQPTEIDNLIVMPAGPQPMNPSELLGSDRMQEIVNMLKEHCDLVLFDTPSTIVFSDGPMLASWIDAVIMVISANQAPRGTEVQTRDLLRKARANILGVVVNRMSVEMVDSCRYYKHYYSDSVPSNPALGSYKTQDNGNGHKKINIKPEPAIPAPEASAHSDEDDNPFPD